MLRQASYWPAIVAAVLVAVAGCSVTPKEADSGPTIAPALNPTNATYDDLTRQFSPQNHALGTIKPRGNALTTTFKKASAAVSQALAIKPKVIPAYDPVSLASQPPDINSEVYYQAARLHEHRGDVQRAMQQYEKALERDSQHVSSLISLARLYGRQDDTERAQKLYARAVAADPENAIAHNDLGLCHARRGELPAARKSFAAAVDLEPKRTLYRNNLAVVLVESGLTDQAFEQLSQVHSEPVALYNLGCLLRLAGRHEESQRLLALAAEADPSLTRPEVAPEDSTARIAVRHLPKVQKQQAASESLSESESPDAAAPQAAQTAQTAKADAVQAPPDAAADEVIPRTADQ